MTATETTRLASVFVELADTLVDDFDLLEFLQLLTAQASELADARAAGLMLADPRDRLNFMAASDERVHVLDLFQVQADEGPCFDCYRQGRAVSEPDLRTASARWPKFAPEAVKAGFGAVHAFPMRLRREVIGSMGLFADRAGPMRPEDVAIIQALADIATIGMLQERAIRRGEVVAEQLQTALNSRVVVEQAKGVIAQIYRVTVDEAFELLRQYCRRRGLRLGEIAALIVADPHKVPDLRGR